MSLHEEILEQPAVLRRLLETQSELVGNMARVIRERRVR